MVLLQAGWLTDMTQWLWEAIKRVWDAFADFIGDLFVTTLDQVLSAVLYVLDLIPLPDFMEGQSIGSMLGQAGPTILWFADVFQVGPSLTAIGTAMVFYVVRRILTVGIW